MRYFLLILFFIHYSSYASERSDAFLVKVYDQYVKVISPDKVYSSVSIIIENHTLSNLTGKLVKGSADHTFVTIKPDKNKSILVKYQSQENLVFVPLAPAFQEVQLIVGKKSYEIPPQK